MKDYARRSGNSTKPHNNKAESPMDETNNLINQLWHELQGTWVGSDGYNVMAVPSKVKTDGALKDSAIPLFIKYAEELKFLIPGAPARNRGQGIDQYVAALEYHQRVWNKESNELMHVENGMFLNLSNIIINEQENPEEFSLNELTEYNMARSGTIPHGDSIMLLGTVPQVLTPPESIPENDTFPSFPLISASASNIGNINGYFEYEPITPKGNPNLVLKEYIQKQNSIMYSDENAILHPKYSIQKVIKFEFEYTPKEGQEDEGGITNIPYIKRNANAISMNATFWLEKVLDNETGQEFDQLQYSQIINLEFMRPFPKPDGSRSSGLINWPHITVNTLVKQ